jgi:CRP-like cAMP-binding protein
MITNIQSTPEFDTMNARLKDLADELMDGIRADDENILLEQGSVLSGPAKTGQESFYLLTEGNVPAMIDERILFYYEAGELIGLESAGGVGSPLARCEFAVRANIYEASATLKKIRKDADRFALLMEYMAVQTACLHQLLASSLTSSKRPHFQMRAFNPGENIISQGDTDTDVYSMISGKANVMVDGRKVGEIGDNEIFGEMSRLTGAPRSATVQAATPCEVMVFGGEDFVNLADSNPAALKDIARNLSERLAHLNKEIAKPKA